MMWWQKKCPPRISATPPFHSRQVPGMAHIHFHMFYDHSHVNKAQGRNKTGFWVPLQQRNLMALPSDFLIRPAGHFYNLWALCISKCYARCRTVEGLGWKNMSGVERAAEGNCSLWLCAFDLIHCSSQKFTVYQRMQLFLLINALYEVLTHNPSMLIW